jgi:hypothetical protein
MRRLALAAIGLAVLAGCAGKPADVKGPLAGGAAAPDVSSDPRATAEAKGAAFLLSKQNAGGGFGSFKGQPASSVGVTALVAVALIDSDLKLTEQSSPQLAAAIKYVVANQQGNGALAAAGQGMENYHTSAAVIALSRTGNPAHKPVLDKAREFLRTIQLGEQAGVEKTNPFFGGAGYSTGAKYSDLSNTAFWIDAMKELGVANDDPAMQNALVFVRRVTNNSEVNDIAWAKDVAPEDFGGAVYRPAAAPGREGPVDISKAGQPEGRKGWRSYGSMTYAMFKSFISAGAKPDDPAIQGALTWIEKNYTLDENPGIGADGQYYYYRLFAKALDAWGEDSVGGHRWADELADKLVALQNEDGSWVNPKDRWHEGDPALVTAYALDALSIARRAAQKGK